MTIERNTRWLGALAGIASAAVSLGVAELVAVVTGPRTAPVIAVGGVVVDSVPRPVKEFATSTFGVHDKTALIIGTLILLGIFAAVIGALAMRDIRIGYAGIAVFGLIGSVAAVTRPDVGAGAFLPSLLGALAGAATMMLLIRRFQDAAASSNAPDVARRSIIIGSLAAIGGAFVVGVIGRQLGDRRNVAGARNAVVLPAPVSKAPVLPPNPGIAGQTSFVTSNSDFYRIDTALIVPQVDPDTWTLRVHGRVSKPITLTYQQLLARPMIERYITLCCVSNEVGGDLIGNARFLGVPLKDLLEEAGPDPAADQLVGRSTDGFTAGSPMAAVMDGRDAMLAVGMNGEPLPVDHGFPVRVVIPGLYGYVSATKWVTELEVTTFDAFDAYWVPRGWSQLGPIKTESRIDTPSDGSKVKAGPRVIAGVAWAQHRGISKVEVRVDDGAWQTAALDAVPSTDTWRQWQLPWTATHGTHRIQVRATDNAGITQTEQKADPAPDGATGWHTVAMSVS